MKDLFITKFPFVELDDFKLTENEKEIKRTFEQTYNLVNDKETENDKLRTVRKDDKRTGK